MATVGRANFSRFEPAESSSVNAMINAATKPVIPPASEKPHIPVDKPHIPTKPSTTTFSKDGGLGSEAIGIFLCFTLLGRY